MASLYISGPVTGIELRNYPAFRDAQRLLGDSGYYADIPHDLVNPDDTHETAMLLCVNEGSLQAASSSRFGDARGR